MILSSCGLFKHPLEDKITFSPYTLAPGSEMRMRYFRPGNDEKSYTQREDKEGHPRAHVCHPRLRLGWQFTRALDWPTLYLPCCVICYFALVSIITSSIHVREMILDSCPPRFARATNSDSSENHLSRTSIEMYYYITLDTAIALTCIQRSRRHL